MGPKHTLKKTALETDCTMPYLIYTDEPTAATKKFIAAVKALYETR
ncbi:hypothetical protein [Bacilliculturomica massiliensis]|nr:hypothetical protein [Bacilliculturomica massiliensis]